MYPHIKIDYVESNPAKESVSYSNFKGIVYLDEKEDKKLFYELYKIYDEDYIIDNKKSSNLIYESNNIFLIISDFDYPNVQIKEDIY